MRHGAVSDWESSGYRQRHKRSWSGNTDVAHPYIPEDGNDDNSKEKTWTSTLSRLTLLSRETRNLYSGGVKIFSSKLRLALLYRGSQFHGQKTEIKPSRADALSLKKFQTQEAKSRETKEAGIEDGIKEGNDERPPQRRKVRHEPKEVDDMVVLMKLPNCLDVVQHAELWPSQETRTVCLNLLKSCFVHELGQTS